MWGIAAIVSFLVALILWVAQVSKGVFITWEFFTIAGLLCLAVFLATPWGRRAWQGPA